FLTINDLGLQSASAIAQVNVNHRLSYTTFLRKRQLEKLFLHHSRAIDLCTGLRIAPHSNSQGARRAARATDSRSRLHVGARGLTELGFATLWGNSKTT